MSTKEISLELGESPIGSPHGEEIVRQARSRVGERRYDIFRNNCEHFCSWCQVGESRSRQVDLFLRRIQSVKCVAHNMLLRVKGCAWPRQGSSITVN